jgi:hypothetical protein
VVNPQRDLFAAWGLGTSSTWYAYNPWTVWSTIQLQKKERIAYVYPSFLSVMFTPFPPFFDSLYVYVIQSLLHGVT